ncbi:MAG TPA: hypothetical protein VJ110_00095 [Candidatus Nanoarchaeia archaeon]|nr:hypothetical protein [Candidatus Nanoarchaeia archaeon]
MSRFLIGRNNSGKLGVYLITNLDKMNFIMSRLLPENCNPNFKTRVVLLDMDEYRSYYSKARHYMKFDYSKVFDPKTCSWRYEHEKYMAELQKLAGKA